MVLLLREHVTVSFLILFYVTGNKSAVYKKLEYLKDAETGDKFNEMLTTIANLNGERMKALKRYTELDHYSAGTGILRDAGETKTDPLVAILKLNDYHGQADDGLLYEDDVFLTTPREIPVADISHMMKVKYNKDNEEQNKFELRSLIANLSTEAIKKHFDSGIIPIEIETTKNDTKSISVPISSSMVPVFHSSNNENEIDLSNYKMRIYNGESLEMSDIKDDLRMWTGGTRKARKICVKACKGAHYKICDDYKCSSSLKSDFKKNCKSECKKYF